MTTPRRDAQPVIYSSTGEVLHVPHIRNGEPLCGARSENEWQESTYGEHRDWRRLCVSCADMAEEVPRLADFGES